MYITYTSISMYIYIMWQDRITFVTVHFMKTPAIPSRMTQVDPNSWVYIDDFYQKVRPLSLRTPLACTYTLTHSTADMSTVSHSRHVRSVTQQTCLLCHTADMSCCVTQQTCLLCGAAGMITVLHNRHVCCTTQQTCLLCHTAEAVSHSRHVCFVAQQTCLLCDTAHMSAL